MGGTVAQLVEQLLLSKKVPGSKCKPNNKPDL